MSWSDADREDTTIYKVLMNHEEQFSIWPEYKETPNGWTDIGKSGPKAECLAYIKEVWTDMRPLSLRKKMEELAQNPPTQAPSTTIAERDESLVDLLCAGEHPLVLSMHPGPSAKGLKEAVDSGYVRVKFTNTMG